MDCSHCNYLLIVLLRLVTDKNWCVFDSAISENQYIQYILYFYLYL